MSEKHFQPRKNMLLFAKYEYNRLIIKRQNIEIDSLEFYHSN